MASGARSGVEGTATTTGNWDGPTLMVETRQGDYQEVALFPGAYSQPFSPRANPVQFYVAGPTGDSEVEPVGEPVAIPANLRDPLLILRWSDGALQSHVIDKSAGSFPFGSFQVVNLSQLTVGLGVADIQPEPIEADSNAVVNPGQVSGYAPLQLFSEVRETDGSTRYLSSGLSTRVLLHPSRRTLILVFDSQDHPSKVGFQVLMDLDRSIQH